MSKHEHRGSTAERVKSRDPHGKDKIPAPVTKARREAGKRLDSSGLRGAVEELDRQHPAKSGHAAHGLKGW